MKDLKRHLFDTVRPALPHLANGYEDWQRFGFDSLAVAQISGRGATLRLVLSASDPAAARRGLAKYRVQWNELVSKWFACGAEVEVVRTEGGLEQPGWQLPKGG